MLGRCVFVSLHMKQLPGFVSYRCIKSTSALQTDHHSDHNRVLSARRSVCVNGRHRGEPVHLFNQSLTGGERTPGCLSDLSRGGGQRPRALGPDFGWDDLWPLRCFISVREQTCTYPFCPSVLWFPSVQRFDARLLNVARNTTWIRLVLHQRWRNSLSQGQAMFWKCWTGCYYTAVSDNPPDISFSHSKMKTKGGI